MHQHQKHHNNQLLEFKNQIFQVVIILHNKRLDHKELNHKHKIQTILPKH